MPRSAYSLAVVSTSRSRLARLLRGARPPHGPGAGGAWPSPSTMSMPGRGDRERPDRRHHHQGVRLRHHSKGLRPHAGARPLRGTGPPDLGVGQGHHRFLAGTNWEPPKRWSCCRVAYHSACSHAAWPTITEEPKQLLRRCWLHGDGCAGRPYLLRLGRHLQHPAAGDRRQLRDEGRRTSTAPPGPRRRRQYRLHHSTCPGMRSVPSRTRSSCWTGPTAARFPGAWRSWRSSSRTCRSPIASRKSISTRDLRIRPAGPTP